VLDRIQPRSRGFSMFGFSPGLVRFLLPFESVVARPTGVVLALVPHVRLDPLQVLGPETHHAVPCLPLQELAATPEPLVDFMRRCSFQCAHKLTDCDRGQNGQADVDVRLGSADFVDEHAGGVHEALSETAMDKRLDFGSQQRLALLGVSDDVKMYFAVEVTRHVQELAGGCSGSSRASRSPVNGAPENADDRPCSTRRQRRA
jgi:hypothetical protein